MKVWLKGKFTKKTPKHSPKVMLWEGISLRGKTFLFTIVGTMDSIVYQDIIDGNLSKMFELYPEGNFTLQQDNTRPHTSRSTTDFMKRKKILVLKWPAGSLDLNPIENI
jgi:hypothetical protein